jgi:anti-anti-sigma factor
MTASQGPFHYDVEHSDLADSEDPDSRGTKITTFRCHGRLAIETRDQIREMFQKHPFLGHIVIDLSNVSYIDSAGLGALVRLKMSAIREPRVSVRFIGMTPRIVQLLKIANLTDWFAS